MKHLVLVLMLFSKYYFGQEIVSQDQLLQKLISFKSLSFKEKESTEFLINFCKEKGLFVKEFTANDSSYNFSASLFDLSLDKPNIILTSHLDVVDVPDETQWSLPPFKGLIKNDTIFGRGAIDCFGLAVMQIFALLEFKTTLENNDFPYNITFLGVSGEEVNSQYGAKYVIEQHKCFLNPVVILGEGGSGMANLVPSKPNLEIFGISVAEKSSLWLRLDVVKVKAPGHGSVPTDLYANKRLLKSLIKLMDEKREVKFTKTSRKMFRELGKLEGGLKGFIIKHINWTILWPFVKKYFKEGEIFHILVKNTFVITDMGSINSSASNQIASGAYAVLDCRLLPGTDVKKFIKKVQNTVGNKIEVSIISESPNSKASELTREFDLLKQAIQNKNPEAFVTPILFPASTDNNFFRLQGIPTYGLIPFVMNRSQMDGVHGINEFITLENLKKGKEIYLEYLRLHIK